MPLPNFGKKVAKTESTPSVNGNKPGMGKKARGPAVSFRDLMGQVAEAETSGSGNYITQHGRYIFALSKLWFQSKFNGPCTIAEFVVVDAKRSGPEDPHPVGYVVSTVFPLGRSGKTGDYLRGLFKTFFCQLIGWDEDSHSDEEYKAIGDELITMDPNEESPLLGKLIEGRTHPKTTQEKGLDIIAVKWAHMEQSEEERAECAQGLRDGTWPEVE